MSNHNLVCLVPDASLNPRDDRASETGSLVDEMLHKFSAGKSNCPTFKTFMGVLSDSEIGSSMSDDELQCRRLYCDFIHAKMEMEMRKKDLELECWDVQLEQLAQQLQSQEDRLLQLMVTMEDTEKQLGIQESERRVKFEHGQPEEKGKWYWIFHKHQRNIQNAITSSVPELAQHLAKEGVITPTMEKYFSTNSSIPSGSIAEELVVAVQVSLDHNHENFKKVIDVLKSAADPRCQKMGYRLALEYELSTSD